MINIPTKAVKKQEISAPPEINSWKPKILVVKDPQHSCWFVDSATDTHVYNNLLLMTQYQKPPIKIGEFISDRISLGWGKIRFRLGFQSGSKGLILNLLNVYYFLYSLYNLVSLELLNNSRFYHNNKNKMLYKVKTRQILAQV